MRKYGFILLALLLLSFLVWLWSNRFEEYTNDAYVEGNQIFITPLIDGFVTAIHTDDTFLVKQGQLLVEMDKTDALIALESAKDEFGKVVREVCQAYHQVFIYQADIGIKTADLIKTEQDYEHRLSVLDLEGVSLEDFEHAVAFLRESEYALSRAKALYQQALAFVEGVSIREHPLVKAASDRVRDAWVRLYRCDIYAPVNGLAAQRTIQVGMWAPAGTPFLSVIPLDQIWVNANYKETQMKQMRLGQKVKITSDLYGDDIIYHGIVVGMPGAAGNIFSLLPPQNLSGNWIKIVQRLPVRVALDPEELRTHPLRLGLSMESRVDIRDTEGLLVPGSTKGSPLYETPIFKKEEMGDLELIERLFKENMDLSLERFAYEPLCE